MVERALGIQFEPLARLDTAQLGLIWQRFRDRFPRTETHPPLPPAVERFEGWRPFQLEVQIEVAEAPPVPRLWLLDEAGTELIQVQPDRFLRNLPAPQVVRVRLTRTGSPVAVIKSGGKVPPRLRSTLEQLGTMPRSPPGMSLAEGA